MYRQTSKQFPQPLDIAALALILVLSLLIGGLLWTGASSAPTVTSFSWEDKQVGAEDKGFILTFNRPMDRASVEANLRINPPLLGKISWAGRRMAYTITMPVPYGQEFEVQLQGARDRFTSAADRGAAIVPFSGRFRSRDRAFVYLGVRGNEQGKLILYNLTGQQKTVLTPDNLSVMDYKPYPSGDRILFSASDRKAKGKEAFNQNLYTVTTGIQPQLKRLIPSTPQPAGFVELVLDSKDYRNLRFDLSPDGQIIIVQRQNQQNPEDFGLWMLQNGRSPKPLENQPGGDFLITGDSRSVALLQGQGVAILPFEPKAKPLDFLPEFEMVLNFAPDNSAAAMVKFGRDPDKPSRSLYLVPNSGVRKELFRTTGRVLSAQFDPTGKTLYCLLTQLIEGEEYKEEPYIAAIDIQTAKIKPLVLLPRQRDIHISLSSDGLALLFDQTVSTSQAGQSSRVDGPRTSAGEAVTTSRLWLLPLAPDATSVGSDPKVLPEQLPFDGFLPRWLP